MYKRLTAKIVAIIVVAVVALCVVAVLLSNMQTQLYQESYTDEMQEEFSTLTDSIESAEESAEDDTKTFDDTYKSLAQSISYMASHDAGYEATHDKMLEYQSLLDVDNVLIVKKDGTIVAEAQGTKADYSSSRFNELRTVFDTGAPSEPIEVEVVSRDYLVRFYSARIDDDTMVVLEVDPTELRMLIEEDGSTQSVLQNIDIGTYGYMFAVSARDYEILWHPDNNVTGGDALEDGIDVAGLEDGEYSWMEFNGESLYCGVKLIGETYYIAAVPESEMTATRNITVAVILFAFAIVMAVVIMYGIFTMRENARKGVKAEDVTAIGPFRYNKTLGRRGLIVSVVGLVAVLVVAFYMQTLFALSSVSVTNNERVNDIVDNMDNSSKRVEELTDRYSERYLPMCEVAGYILDANPSLKDREDLQELADILDIQSLLVYDSSGKLQSTNSTYTNYSLSDDPDSEFYEFNKVLQGGMDYLVQDPETDEVSGEVWQYIGVPLHNEEGYVDGMLQIAIKPILLERFLSAISVDTVLANVNSGNSGMAFAVNKDDDTFAYWPLNPRYEDQESVFDHGMTENELKDGFNDYITIDNVTYYAASAELSSAQLNHNYYVYLAGNESELMSERLPLTVVTGLIALVCLAIIYLLVVFESNRRPLTGTSTSGGGGSGEGPDGPDGSGEGGEEGDIDVIMPSGRTVQTEAAASRWVNFTTNWRDKSAWQKTMTLTRYIMAVVIVIVFLVVIFQDQVFEDNSIFSYILIGSWEPGFNVFAITACIMFICVAVTVVAVVQWILGILSSILNARGETICRLLSSFVRYGTVIGMIFYCLTLFGVDAVTLLASAGILALAISLGAQSLISDVLSGLFIIFEGEFRVGDIITVGDWRGTVLEIGIRTTKVEDASQNVKVIRNSDISNVVNMTKKLSFVSCDIGIDYGESLERVESILDKELAGIADRLPAIVNGPYYRGVTSLGDNSVDLRISAQCLEADRYQLERDLNRELKLLFDEYDINIPYPQVVVNEPIEYREATETEKEAAKRFAREQARAAKKLGEELGGDE